jgi:hypothetical protein
LELTATEMALKIETSSPKELIAAVREAIRTGVVTTWTSTKEGYLTFTGAGGNWKSKAWFKPAYGDGYVKLYILRPKGERVSVATYAVYHARFVEMLLIKFEGQFDAVTASATAETKDVV